MDAIRFNPCTGAVIWRTTFPDVFVGILERRAFNGIWSRIGRVGVINFESGSNAILHESPRSLGWPLRDGSNVIVPWHSKGEVGIIQIGEQSGQVNETTWRQPRIVRTQLHSTAAGLALQTNDQTIWWLGHECQPLWNALAKPYVYGIHRAIDTDVFVGTDGNGGRLLAFDAASGGETLQLKPILGGVGDLAKLPGHDTLVAAFRESRSYSIPPRLLVLSMHERRHTLDHECFQLLTTWDHGVVCRTGQEGEHLAVIDIRSSGFLR